MTSEEERRDCPQCGRELDRCEDPFGVSWQCHQYDCLGLFGDDEINGDHIGDSHE